MNNMIIDKCFDEIHRAYSGAVNDAFIDLVKQMFLEMKRGKSEEEAVCIWFSFLLRTQEYFDSVPRFLIEFISTDNFKLIEDIGMSYVMTNKHKTIAQLKREEKVAQSLIEIFERCVLGSERCDSDTYLNIAKLYMKTGQYGDAIKILKREIYTSGSVQAGFVLIDIYRLVIESMDNSSLIEIKKVERDLLDLFRFMRKRTDNIIRKTKNPVKKDKAILTHIRVVNEEVNYYKHIKEYRACYQLLNSEIEKRPFACLWNELGELFESDCENTMFDPQKAKICYKNGRKEKNVRRVNC